MRVNVKNNSVLAAILNFDDMQIYSVTSLVGEIQTRFSEICIVQWLGAIVIARKATKIRTFFYFPMDNLLNREKGEVFGLNFARESISNHPIQREFVLNILPKIRTILPTH